MGQGIRLIRRHIEERAEQRAWELYASAYPHFAKKNFKTFDQFYPKKKKPKVAKTITQAEMDRFADIADLMRGGKSK